MFHNISGETANDVWRSALNLLKTDESVLRQPSRTGPTRELLRTTLSIADPRQRWVSVREPAMNPAFAIAEVVWIVSGRNDAAFLNYFNRELSKFSGDSETYHGAYGHRIRKHFGLDQLEQAYHILRRNRDSRQVVLQIWDVSKDLPDSSGAPRNPDIPCNIFSCLNIREGKLEWLQVLRSNDVFRGLPYNLVQFTCLQEVVAGWLEIGISSYNQLSNSLHIYEADLSLCGTVPEIRLNTKSDDSLAVTRRESEISFEHLENTVLKILDDRLSSNSLYELASGNIGSLRTAFHNFQIILCAEGIRRRGDNKLAQSLTMRCTNEPLRTLMLRWIRRWQPDQLAT